MKILNKSQVKEKIENRVNSDVAAGRIGGAAVLIKQNGEVVYNGFFGNDGRGREINDKTLFRLASMTKPITAVAILKQVERGLVSLDDPLDKFIPEYAEMEIGALDENKNIVTVGKAKTRITVKHLLSHSGGIGSGVLAGALDKLTADKQTDLKSITDAYASLPLSFEPYTSQAYSATLGFDLLARIIELTSGQPYDEFLKKEIFEPLGMQDTTFAPTEEQWERMTLMHSFKDGKSSFAPLNKNTIFGGYPLTYFCGGAGLASTLADYEKFVNMLASRGKKADGEQFITSELIDLMAVPASSCEFYSGEIWGLSVRVIIGDKCRIPQGSYGWSGAYGCHFWVDPANQITAIYMKNSTYDGGASAKTAFNLEIDVYS